MPTGIMLWYFTVLVSTGLLSNVDPTSATTISKTISGQPGESGYLKSETFDPIQDGQGDIYVYNFATSKGATIAIFATDFDLYPHSSMKVFDTRRKGKKNKSTTTSIVIWTGRDRPAYQSTTNKLKLVFKEGKYSASLNQSYFGFKIKYLFTDGSRATPSLVLPAIGNCGEMDLTKHGQVRVVGGASLTYFSCVWVVRHTEAVTVKVTSVYFSQGPLDDYFSVGGHISSDSLSLVYITKDQLSPGLPQTVSQKNMYIRLDMRLGLNEYVEFEYYTQSTQSQVIKPVIGSGCLYKQCDTKCANYWQSCETGKDTSCDHKDATYKCGNRCYLRADTCDRFNDCEGSSSEDEKNCFCNKFSTKSERDYVYYLRTEPKKSRWPDMTYLGKTQSSSKCAEYCRLNKQCQVYTYYSESYDDSSWRRQCYGMLRNKALKSKNSTAVVSGIRECEKDQERFPVGAAVGGGIAGFIILCVLHAKSKAKKKAAATPGQTPATPAAPARQTPAAPATAGTQTRATPAATPTSGRTSAPATAGTQTPATPAAASTSGQTPAAAAAVSTPGQTPAAAGTQTPATPAATEISADTPAVDGTQEKSPAPIQTSEKSHATLPPVEIPSALPPVNTPGQAPAVPPAHQNSDSVSVYVIPNQRDASTDTSYLDPPPPVRRDAWSEIGYVPAAPPLGLDFMALEAPPSYDVAVNLLHVEEGHRRDNIPPPPVYSLHPPDRNNESNV